MAFESKTYCLVKEKYRCLKSKEGYGGVMVRISPLNEENIKEARLLIERICPLEIDGITEGDFLMFTQMGEHWKNKLEFFLKEFSCDGKLYSVSTDVFDVNESYELFYKRIKRHVGAVEISNRIQNR